MLNQKTNYILQKSAFFNIQTVIIVLSWLAHNKKKDNKGTLQKMIMGFFQRRTFKKIRKDIVRIQNESYSIFEEYSILSSDVLPPKKLMLKEMMRAKEMTKSSTWREEAVMDGLCIFINKYDEAYHAAVSAVKAIIGHGNNFISELDKIERMNGLKNIDELSVKVWNNYMIDVHDQLGRTTQFLYAFTDSLKRQFDLLPDIKMEIERGSFFEEQIKMIKKEEVYYLERIRMYEVIAREMNDRSGKGLFLDGSLSY